MNRTGAWRIAVSFLAPPLVAAFLLVPGVCGAVTLQLVEEKTPFPGITLRQYKTPAPKCNLWAVLIDLCQDSIHVEATTDPDGIRTAANFGADVGVQVAVNGDFYKTDPLHVYGAAVGGGISWPEVEQGFHPDYTADWYFKKFGWIAFGPDWVEFTHSKWVKNNVAGLDSGWKPGSVVTTVPPGTLALVSGFSQLVIDGEPVTCPDPTASTCFPDRSDMRDRHPRTAMGITQDRQTFILLVVDGRTDLSKGMYGTELAAVMHKLGAHQAFNLDGGGSSQLWVKGQGTINDANGNNNGGGLRPVLNHWGIFAGAASGKPKRPGHCVTSPPCAVLPAEGGTLDDAGPCFGAYGNQDTWRKESTGWDGTLHWTNAWKTAIPDNWAWWQVHLAESGKYRVDYYAVPEFALFMKTHYEIRASGETAKLAVDQSVADGWTELGTFDFSAGGGQWVAVFDDAAGSVAAEQHIVADAVRLVRVDPWCGNGLCDGAEECMACPADCGECPEACGNGVCAEGETCAVCPGDCGPCGDVCGDGQCSGSEACSTCPDDCGQCPGWCGDGSCQEDESCEACPADCGECPAGCGDGACEPEEDCASCPADCGECPAEPFEVRFEDEGSVSPAELLETMPVDGTPTRGELLPVGGDGAVLPADWNGVEVEETVPGQKGGSAPGCSSSGAAGGRGAGLVLLAFGMILALRAQRGKA